jgi:hypothetical protein
MTATAAPPAAFSRAGALALIAGGFALFLALVYLIGAGESFGGNRGAGQAHAAANGLNGYSGLVRLAEAEGYTVERSRNGAGLETEGLLVLTPPLFTDADELARILKKREQIGPTLVILAKWEAAGPPPNLPQSARGKFKRGWVVLDGAVESPWTANLPAPYTFESKLETLEKDKSPGWDGLGHEGLLPTRTIAYAGEKDIQSPLVTDAAGHWLAFKVDGEEGSDYYKNAHWTVFVTEPDLLNNYGLADKARAAAAIALIKEAAYQGDITEVTFDLTLNGLGASENLLTLAFRPPFLAATLSLIVALLIVGWRAFQRFGPAAASGGPGIAFGKRQLILNGASLILRARRFGLLAAPYAALSARRIAERLGLARHDGPAIDAALARRLPDEEPFTRRAARLEAADKPAAILAAARSIDDLANKLQQGPSAK